MRGAASRGWQVGGQGAGTVLDEDRVHKPQAVIPYGEFDFTGAVFVMGRRPEGGGCGRPGGWVSLGLRRAPTCSPGVQ